MSIILNGFDDFKDRIDPDKARAALLKTMQQVVRILVAYVQNDELSGQVLHIRTDRLKASITGSSEVDGDVITGKIGTNVVYAAIQEFGGTIHRYSRTSIKAQNRRQRDKVLEIGGYGAVVTARKGSFIKGTNSGHGNTFGEYDIVIPARPYLGPALDNNQDTIQSMFQQTIDVLLEGK